MIRDFFKRIINEFQNDESESDNANSNAYRRNKIILTAGRYIGGIDVPCGIYNVKILSGDGTVDTEDVHNEKDRYFCVRLCLPGKSYNGLSHFPPSYNGLEIFRDMIIKIGGTARIEFCFLREVIETAKIENEQYQRENLGEFKEQKSDSRANFDFDSMDGWEFERFCADVLKKNRYDNVEVTKGSGDQGVDVLAERDGIKYAIQCKHYSHVVGNKAVQEIFAGKQFYHCHVGIVMTNNYFTQSAKELAKENGIILWDKDYLSRFLKGYDDCEYVQGVGNYILDPEQEFIEAEPEQELVKPEQRVVCEKRVEKRKEKKNIMYDREKGIYPPGVYVVGEDIEVGKYILNAQKGDRKDPFISFYENYSKYRKDETSQYERFDDDYYVSLRENGMVISVRDADIKRL